MIPKSEYFLNNHLEQTLLRKKLSAWNRSNPGKQLFSLQRQLCKCVLNCSGHLIMTPNYANLFIHLLEQYFIYNSPTQPKTRQRQEASFRDDYLIFRYHHSSSLWTGTVWGEPYLWAGLLQSLWDIRRWADMTGAPAEAVWTCWSRRCS